MVQGSLRRRQRRSKAGIWHDAWWVVVSGPLEIGQNIELCGDKSSGMLPLAKQTNRSTYCPVPGAGSQLFARLPIRHLVTRRQSPSSPWLADNVPGHRLVRRVYRCASSIASVREANSIVDAHEVCRTRGGGWSYLFSSRRILRNKYRQLVQYRWQMQRSPQVENHFDPEMRPIEVIILGWLLKARRNDALGVNFTIPCLVTEHMTHPLTLN